MRQTTSVTVIDAGNQQTDTAEKGKQQQRYNRHLRESVCSLALAVKSASQSQFEQRLLTAKQQALCDILLHQNLFAVLLQQHQAAVQPPESQLQAAVIAVQQWDHNCLLCTSAQQQLLQDGSSPCAAAPAGQSLLNGGQHTLLTEACAGNHQGSQHNCRQQTKHASTAIPTAHGALPSSYVARLLLSATKQQLKHAASMTAHDWQSYFAALMPQLLMLLEMTTRHQYQLARSASQQQPNNTFHLAEPAHSKGLTPGLLSNAAIGGDRLGQVMASTSTVQVTGAASHSQGLPCNVPCADSCGCAGSSAQADGVACTHKHPVGACTGLAAAVAAADGVSTYSSCGPQLLQGLCADPHPLGVCPVMDLAQLLQTVDSAMTLMVLALVRNHLPMVLASVFNYSPGHACTAGMQHWQAVVQRMQLTEDQEVQLSVCMDEFKRLAGTARQLGTAVLPHVDAPSLILAAEQAQQSRSRSPSLQQDGAAAESPHTPAIVPNLQAGQQAGQQQHGARCAAGSKKSRGGRGKGGSKGSKQGKGVAASAQPGTAQRSAAQGMEGCSFKELDQQLLRYAQLQHLHMFNLVSFVINTLSRPQLAVAFVGAYPFAPDFLALAAAASEALAQRQQQRLEQQEQAVLQREAAGSGGDDAAEPDPAAATTTGAPAAAAAAAAASTGRKRKSRGRGRKGAGSDSDASAKAAGVQQQAQPPGGSSQSLLQQVTQAHVEQRAAELLMHQELCWADLQALKTLQPSNQPPQQVSKQAQGQAAQSDLQSQEWQRLKQWPSSHAARLQQVQQHKAHQPQCRRWPEEQSQHWPNQQMVGQQQALLPEPQQAQLSLHTQEQQPDQQLKHQRGTLLAALGQQQSQAAVKTEQLPLAAPSGLQPLSELLPPPPPQLPKTQTRQQHQQLLLSQLQQQLLHDAVAGPADEQQQLGPLPVQPQQQNDKTARQASTLCAGQFQKQQQEPPTTIMPQHLLRAASMGCDGAQQPDLLRPASTGTCDNLRQQHLLAGTSPPFSAQHQLLLNPLQQHELLAPVSAPFSEQGAQPQQLLDTAALWKEDVQSPCCQPETAPLILANAQPLDVDC